MDRNTLRQPTRNHGEVALLAEGVDRNDLGHIADVPKKTSPSSRRAWIEMAFLMYSRLL